MDPKPQVYHLVEASISKEPRELSIQGGQQCPAWLPSSYMEISADLGHLHGGVEQAREAAVHLPPAYFLYWAIRVLICTMFLTKGALSSVTSHPREDKLTATNLPFLVDF